MQVQSFSAFYFQIDIFRHMKGSHDSLRRTKALQNSVHFQPGTISQS